MCSSARSRREAWRGCTWRPYAGPWASRSGWWSNRIRPELASDDAFVRRFVEEAKTAVELSHPNIVPVYELGVEQGVYYLAMEFCAGATLAEILNETGPLSAAEGAYVGVEICRALDYAHRRAGIVHRDVTPRNVMLDEEGAVRLIDFGIAAPATLAGAEGRRGDLFGSPGHMPPEQIEGGRLTPATDVFAVAVLLAEAWTGRPPFRRATPEECAAALEEPPERLDGELAPVAELVESAMSRDPDERPESAEAFARPLREFVKSADLGDVARRLGERVRRARRRLLASSPWLLDDEAGDSAPVEGTQPLRTPADAPVVTRTFAARGEMVEWTRKLPSVPPPPSDEPTPTTASNGGEPARPRSGSGWRLAAVLLAGVVIAGVISVRFGGGPSPAVSTSATPATVAPTPTPTPTPTRPRPPPSAAPPASASAVPTKAPRVPPVVSAEPSSKARLNLTATLPSTVSVDGRPRGTTPVTGVELSAGTHSVVFQNSMLGERLSASVKLAAGQTRTVAADFKASPSPRVYIR